VLKRSTIGRAKTAAVRTPNDGPAIYIPVYLSTDDIPEADRHNPRLTISSPALTDAEELRKLADLARGLWKERNEAVPYGQSAGTLQVIGPGAYPSSRFPRIGPDAFDNRAELIKVASLIELPEKVRWDDKTAIRRFMAAHFARIEADLEDWRHEQRKLEADRIAYLKS
jgi:hypothetical protein